MTTLVNGLTPEATRATIAGDDAPLLEVKNLRVEFPSMGRSVFAVRGISFSLAARESVAILGESGSGKSVTSKAILGLIDAPPAKISGSISFQGQEIVGRDDRGLRSIRGTGIAMVFQDALDGLNPVYTVGAQLDELLIVRAGMSRGAARAETIRLMEAVGIPAPSDRANDYPHEFSGGMRQRICIALAIALKPRLLIADEPTTALDVTVQAGILRLIRHLRAEAGMGLIFVTHDLSVAASVAERLIVMYAGEIVETGPIGEIFAQPSHPYTRALLRSHPAAVRRWQDLRPIAGSPPDKSEVIAGCSFDPRCRRATAKCSTVAPDLFAVTDKRSSRCHYFEDELNDGG